MTSTLNDYEVARKLIPTVNLLSVQFVTRACPLSCSYCNIVKSPLTRKPIQDDWPKVYEILDKLGVTFNLILGNEPLVLGENLVDLVDYMRGGTPYALYSTAPEPLWSKWRDKLVRAGLSNISTGVDYPRDHLSNLITFTDDSQFKASTSFELFQWALDAGVKACQGTATLQSSNVDIVEQIAYDLTDIGVWFGVNPIHWDKGWTPGTNKKISDLSGFDFFPPEHMIEDELLTGKTFQVHSAIDRLKDARDNHGAKVFNGDDQLDSMAEFVPHGNTWHCTRPTTITVDPDGHLRVCGYRRGEECNKISIYDFEEDAVGTTQRWLKAWYTDMVKCEGCAWSYWSETELRDDQDALTSAQYWGAHGDEHFAEDQWDPIDIGTRGSGTVQPIELYDQVGYGIERVKKHGDWQARKQEILALLEAGKWG